MVREGKAREWGLAINKGHVHTDMVSMSGRCTPRAWCKASETTVGQAVPEHGGYPCPYYQKAKGARVGSSLGRVPLPVAAHLSNVQPTALFVVKGSEAYEAALGGGILHWGHTRNLHHRPGPHWG